ncbi:hypothetical protein ACTFIW_013333 [Dictyostelium discoideum]
MVIRHEKESKYSGHHNHKRHVEEMVLKFLDLGIIKRLKYNYSPPIMLLKKRDSWRVVRDYRQLNKVTFGDDHPFAQVDSLLNQCKYPKLFSNVNYAEHVKYTAFITHISKFEYTRMSQGLVAVDIRHIDGRNI